MVRSEGNMSLKNPVTPPGIDPGTVRLVVQRLNHYATPGPPKGEYTLKIQTVGSTEIANVKFPYRGWIGRGGHLE
jgi:hypothetical protein